MELGIYSFGDNTEDLLTKTTLSPARRMQNLLEEIELADQVGLDFFGLGEHHRPDYIISSPSVVLAAAATRTKNIKLGSAVTVLSSDDPVRVYQQFATLDLISQGRAEILAGRGSFIESFPLFGYDLDDYDELFSEKLELLLEINEKEKVTWSGKLRPSLRNLGVYPRAFQKKLPIWIAVGGSPESAARAGMLGVPLALAIIGGMPERFVPFIDIYRDSGARSGHPASRLAVSINSHGYIADDSRQAADDAFPSHAFMMSKIGRERGWPPFTRSQFEAGRHPRGHLLVGSPQEIVDKILYEYELFDFDRFGIQFSVGSMPHEKILRSIELYGTKVAPAVLKATEAREAAKRASAQAETASSDSGKSPVGEGSHGEIAL